MSVDHPFKRTLQFYGLLFAFKATLQKKYHCKRVLWARSE